MWESHWFWSTLIRVSACLAVAASIVFAQNEGGTSRTELAAESWLNPLSLRHPEDRTLLLYFFSTVQERNGKDAIERLNKVSRRSDVLVIGLSAESKERVAKFIESNKIKFAVGAKSTAYRRFRIKKFPQVVVIPPSECATKTHLESLELETALRRFPPQANAELTDSATFDESSPTDVLKANARENPDRGELLRALGLLRRHIPNEEFLAYCDELLESETDFFRRGNIQFERNLADPNIPEEEKEPLLEPATEASKLNRGTLEDPMWDSLREFMDRRDTLSSGQLLEEYHTHQGNEPSDLLVRRAIADTLGTRPEKQVARDILMQILPIEMDARIRLSIVFGISSVCEPGDFDAADFLEKHLQSERNYRSTRPAMEHTIRYLRTGEE